MLLNNLQPQNLYSLKWNKNTITNLKNFKWGIPGLFLILILLTWRIRWAPNNARKWQMGFNLAFKELMVNSLKETQKMTKILPFGATSNLVEKGTDCSCHICLFVVSLHSLIWLWNSLVFHRLKPNDKYTNHECFVLSDKLHFVRAERMNNKHIFFPHEQH